MHAGVAFGTECGPAAAAAADVTRGPECAAEALAVAGAWFGAGWCCCCDGNGEFTGHAVESGAGSLEGRNKAAAAVAAAIITWDRPNRLVWCWVVLLLR
jgi:hypothetical protein